MWNPHDKVGKELWGVWCCISTALLKTDTNLVPVVLPLLLQGQILLHNRAEQTNPAPVPQRGAEQLLQRATARRSLGPGWSLVNGWGQRYLKPGLHTVKHRGDWGEGPVSSRQRCSCPGAAPAAVDGIRLSCHPGTCSASARCCHLPASTRKSTGFILLLLLKPSCLQHLNLWPAAGWHQCAAGWSQRVQQADKPVSGLMVTVVMFCFFALHPLKPGAAAQCCLEALLLLCFKSCPTDGF